MDEATTPIGGSLMKDSQMLISLQELDTSDQLTKQNLQNSDELEDPQVENVADSEDRSLYALRLKEFAPLTTLFRQIPLRAQHGFSTFDIRFTCLDVVEQYLCIGSNVGVIYVFKRKQQTIQRLKCEGYSNNITCIKILYSLDYLLACGTETGTIFIFKLPANEQRREVEKFQITAIHKHQVTSLEWGQNGMKLFSGDSSGLVVHTDMDYLQNSMKSQEVLKELQPVVQISYSPNLLLVSTTQRLVFCDLDDPDLRVRQIGQNPRKFSGQFGAVFNQHQSGEEVKIYTSRPGLRIWRADTNCVVQETILLKNIIAKQETSIPLLNKPIDSPLPSISDLQFGKLSLYQGLLLLTWNEKSLVIIDPEIKMVVASCINLKLVVDVAVCNDEIFVLQGQRHVIRIASAPEEESSLAEVLLKDSSVLVDLLSPIQELGNILKTKASFQDSSTDIFSWLHKRKPKNAPIDKSNVASKSIPLPEIVDAKTNQHGDADLVSGVTDKVENATECIEGKFGDDVVDRGKPHASRLETLSAWNDDQSDFQVYHVTKKKKQRSNSVPKGQYSSKKSSISSVTHQNEQEEEKAQESDCLSCSSSLTESNMFLQDVGESDPPKRPSRANEDDLLDSILNIYSRFKDSPEDGTAKTEITEKSEESPVSGEGSFTPEKNEPIQEEDSVSEKKNLSFPDVIPEPEQRELVQNTESEEAVIYSSLSPSSPLVSGSLDGFNIAATTGATNETLQAQLLTEWTSHETPSAVISICATDVCLYCVDTEERLFYSPLKGSRLKWNLVKNCPAQFVTANPSGSLLCVKRGGRPYVASLGRGGIPSANQVEIAGDVMIVALDDSAVWYIKQDGSLRVKRLDAQNFGKSQKVNCPWGCSVVACRRGIVWAVTHQGTLICLNDSEWEEVPFVSSVWVSRVSLGSQDTVWVATDGGYWFRTGVTCTNPKGTDCWWQVDLQSERTVYSPDSRMLSPSTHGRVSDQFLSATIGDKGLWFCLPKSSSLLASFDGIVGHSWEKVKLTGIPSALKWQTMAVVNIGHQFSGLWCLYRKGEIFFCSTEDLRPIGVSSSEVGDIVCLAASTSALWVLTTWGTIFMRKDMSANWALGSQWEQVDTGQLGSQRLTHISCSPDIAWGCLDNGDIVARIGPLYSPPGLPLVWLSVDESSPSPVPHFSKVFVGVTGEMVWAIDSGHSVFVREGVKPNFPVGTNWTLVPGLLASELCVLRSQVVAVAMLSGELHVRSGVSSSNCAGTVWKSIPGSVAHLSASSNDAMWGLSIVGQILRHRVTKIQYRSQGSVHVAQLDEDWELI